MLSAYGSVQTAGLRKLACYALVMRDDADVHCAGCELRDCSEAALLVAHRARARLHECRLSKCSAAFMAGQNRGRSLELHGCTIERSTRRLWADADRPRAFVWGERNSSLIAERRWNGVEPLPQHDWGSSGTDDEHSIDTSAIVPPTQPRGYDESDSEDSLEDPATFADMERLMEELDDAAIAHAGPTPR